MSKIKYTSDNDLFLSSLKVSDFGCSQTKFPKNSKISEKNISEKFCFKKYGPSRWKSAKKYDFGFIGNLVSFRLFATLTVTHGITVEFDIK